MENFRAYELALLEAALDYMCFPGMASETVINLPMNISRNLANLLSSARSYIDQMPQHFQIIFGKNSAETTNIKESFSNRYDLVLGYRIMDALRNYTQHRGMPIQSAGLGISWMGEDPDEKFRISCSIYLVPSCIEDDGKFKKAILKELRALGDKIEIKMLVREYIAALSEIHQEAREKIRVVKERSEEVILQAYEDFRSASSDQSVAGVGVVIENEDLTWDQEVYLPSNCSERLTYFSKKNQQLSTLSKFFVSSSSG